MNLVEEALDKIPAHKNASEAVRKLLRLKIYLKLVNC